MKDRITLAAYFCLVVLATAIHDLFYLAAMLACVYMLAFRRSIMIARKAALSIIIFNSVVTLSYIGISLLNNKISLYYICLINLRVFLITSMTFLLHERFSPFRAFAFSQTLLFLLTLSYSQINTFKKLAVDFHLALKSRSIRRLAIRDLYRHAATLGGFFLQKAVTQASEVSQAMRSRGFIND
ncbi:MAG: energy-coupling factor transporter transmembrane protein EcfT [Candidatus Eisenbacteria bacterium]|uniref:Energy-coupling factor transporter transmembrane protein EcfT n=1 Tax=Eiseniibacteriota bacterium TaxID=2212470 RepID=A0A948WEF1_UNCEI|nr:energy-coupling factor transporter transmembrane protein EcfT [Candidatus Eisenbacteria bacterium]MBU1947562.1 energy-coupling factor transporter transmembrane protein EcfT [Candidatus Eisenbacteria bacterium]MBU2692708.1 energy-coupling factor transporter transmembrane protein EcfT [Candidatus Eisenbacteria bacterium]